MFCFSHKFLFCIKHNFVLITSTQWLICTSVYANTSYNQDPNSIKLTDPDMSLKLVNINQYIHAFYLWQMTFHFISKPKHLAISHYLSLPVWKLSAFCNQYGSSLIPTQHLKPTQGALLDCFHCFQLVVQIVNQYRMQDFTSGFSTYCVPWPLPISKHLETSAPSPCTNSHMNQQEYYPNPSYTWTSLVTSFQNN